MDLFDEGNIRHLPMVKMELVYDDNLMQFYPPCVELEELIQNVVETIGNTLQNVIESTRNPTPLYVIENHRTFHLFLRRYRLFNRGLLVVPPPTTWTPSWLTTSLRTQTTNCEMQSSATSKSHKHTSIGSVRLHFQSTLHCSKSTCKLVTIFTNFIPVDRYTWLVNGEAASSIETFMTEEHTFEEYCEYVDKFREISVEIMTLPSIEHYDLIRLDCEDLKRGLSDVAKEHSQTLLKRMAKDHREANEL